MHIGISMIKEIVFIKRIRDFLLGIKIYMMIQRIEIIIISIIMGILWIVIENRSKTITNLSLRGRILFI